MGIDGIRCARNQQRRPLSAIGAAGSIGSRLVRSLLEGARISQPAPLRQTLDRVTRDEALTASGSASGGNL
jgi:hypothetical protein